MSRLLLLGATGSLGRHVLRLALAAGHDVTVLVRTPSKLPPEASERVSVHTGDLDAYVPLDLVKGQGTLINCAGHVAEAGTFEVAGENVVTMQAMVAKNPAAMTNGATSVYTYQRSGDTLTLTQTRGPSGPSAMPVTIKLARVE